MAKNQSYYLKKLIIHYFRFNKLKSLKALFLQITSESLGGINLLMLVPLINMINNVQNIRHDKISQIMMSLFDYLGLEHELITILIFFIITFILITLLQRTSTLINSINQQNFITSMRSGFFNLLTDADWNFLRKEKSSNYVKVVTTDINSCGNAVNQVLTLTSSLMTALINFIIAVILSPLLSVIGIITILILILVIKRNNNLIFKTGSSIQESMKEIYSQITDLINGIKLTKLFGNEEYQKKNFEELSLKIEQQRVKVQIRQFYSRSVYGITAAIFLSAFIYFGVVYFNIGTASLLLLIYIFSRLTSSFSQAFQNYQRIISALPNYADYISYTAKLKKMSEQSEGTIYINDFGKTVEFDNIHFSYDKSRSNLLQGVSFKINKGEITTLIGASGLGKTTIADLMTGMLQPETGNILIDDIDLKSINLRSWRKLIGYINQDSFLYNLSIKENMMLSNSMATDDDMWQALKSASINDFVENLCEKTETIIGERGNLLSGGERQRLTIAVALVRNPKLLILDEATSALDEENEIKIMEIVKSLTPHITTFIISHKKRALEYSDNILKLENHTIIKIK